MLYRVCLPLVLTPVFGLPLTAATCALAHGIGHGYESQAAFWLDHPGFFTIAYAWTSNLWWFISTHAFILLSTFSEMIRAQRLRSV